MFSLHNFFRETFGAYLFFHYLCTMIRLMATHIRKPQVL